VATILLSGAGSFSPGGRTSVDGKIERAAKLVQNFTIIFGVFGALFSYSATQLDKRVANTVEYRKQYVDNIRAKYLGLVSRWDIPETDAVLSKDRDAQKKVTLDFFSTQQNKDDLLNVVDFFDSLGLCAQNNVCDRNTALNMLSDPIRNTFEMSAFYILDKRARERDDSFGAGLQALYKMHRECFFARYF
jgi:hypothetical protein